jgi:hypothetical protein
MRKYTFFIGVIGLAISLMSATFKMNNSYFVSETDETIFSEISEVVYPREEACNIKNIKKYSKIFLNPRYVLESFAYKPYTNFVDKRSIKAVFSVYAGETYRFVDLSEGFSKSVTVNIFNSDGNLIYSSGSNSKMFDFLAVNSGDCTIEWIYQREDSQKPDKKCVAFAIGYTNE